MGGNLGLLVRLSLRHRKSDARFLFFAAGTDLEDDRGFLERTYQLYVALFFVGALALSFAQVASLVAGMRAALGPSAAPLARALAVCGPVAALVGWSVSALRECPLRLAAPDIAWLARTVRPTELLAVQLMGAVPVVALVGALLGYLFGVLGGAAEPLAWAACLATLALAARLLALLAGLARSAAPSRHRRTVTLVVGVLAALLVAAFVALAPEPRVSLAFACLALDALLAALSLVLADRADMAFVVDDNELYAARRSLRFLSLASSGAYREACRRRERARHHRRPRRTWRFWPGRWALVSHALASLARWPSALLGALSWGGLVVPTGVLLMGARVDVGALLMWYVCVAQALREPLSLAGVFREDCATRLVRQLLPAGTLELLALDALPLAVMSALASAAVLAPASALLGGGVAGTVEAVALAWAMLAALVLSAGFDDPQRAARGDSMQLTAFLVGAVGLFAVGLAGLLGMGAALVCALLLDVLLAWLLR